MARARWRIWGPHPSTMANGARVFQFVGGRGWSFCVVWKLPTRAKEGADG